MRAWLVGLMIALNQLANAATGGNPQESVSSRLGRARSHGSRVARALCAGLERVDFHDKARPDHCAEAVLEHERRLRTNLKEHAR